MRIKRKKEREIELKRKKEKERQNERKEDRYINREERMKGIIMMLSQDKLFL